MLMSWHRSVTQSIFLWSFVFSLNTLTEQESPHVDDHRRPSSYSMAMDIGYAESQTVPYCAPAVPYDPPPPYEEYQGWV